MAPPLGSSVARRTGVLLAGAGVLVAAAIWVFRNSYTIPPFALVGAYAFAASLVMFCPRAMYPYWREIWLERVD